MRDDRRTEDFAIGTVAGLTGLDVHTIRAWERRHRAISPRRTETGHRRYGEDQIQRLRLLRAATELGESIGQLAPLNDDELRSRLSRLSEGEVRASDDRARIAIVGPALIGQIAAAGSLADRWEIVHSVERVEDLPEALPEVVVLHAGRLAGSTIERIDVVRTASPHTRWVVIYEFARRAELLALARRGMRAVRGPLRIEALQRALFDLDLVSGAVPAAPPPSIPGGPACIPARRLDDSQLARLREVAGSLDCECTSHLASIVSSLASFEAYSLGCEDTTVEDAALHRRLAEGSARARAEMERLLVHLAAHDGIRL